MNTIIIKHGESLPPLASAIADQAYSKLSFFEPGFLINEHSLFINDKGEMLSITPIQSHADELSTVLEEFEPAPSEGDPSAAINHLAIGSMILLVDE